MAVSWRHERQGGDFRRAAAALVDYLVHRGEATGHGDCAVSRGSIAPVLLLPRGMPVKPMAMRLAPSKVRGMHRSPNHVVADAACSDKAALDRVRNCALAAMTGTSPVVALIIMKQDTHGHEAVANFPAEENRTYGKREEIEVDKRD